MHIDVAKAPAHQVMGFDEGRDVLAGCDRAGAEGLEQVENLPAVLEVAAGQLAEHEGVADDGAGVE